jgi:hypothetical protein
MGADGSDGSKSAEDTSGSSKNVDDEDGSHASECEGEEMVMDEDSDIDADEVIGTQDSTARMPFPQVTQTLPIYMGSESDSGSASGESWLGKFHDYVDSDAFSDVDLEEEGPIDDTLEFEEWMGFHSAESYRPGSLDGENLKRYYRPSSWNSEHVTLLGSRENFTGPRPGCTLPPISTVPIAWSYWDTYWDDLTLDHIVIESNRYATAVLPNGRTKGGPNFKEINIFELRTWLDILLLMGTKRLPSLRNYWKRSETILQCQLIPRAMSVGKWEEIRRVLHLVDNRNMATNSSDPRFDPIAKTRWIIEHFNIVSRTLYNLQREITIDECVIPYKGKYAKIR